MLNLSKRHRGMLEMATAMVLSGTLGYFVLETGQPAHQVVFYRCLLGAVFIGLVGMIFRLFHYLALTWKSFMLCGLCGFAIVANWVLLFSAYRFSTISIATAVYHTQPFFLLLIRAVVYRKALSLGKMLWIFLAFIGVVLTVDLTGGSFFSFIVAYDWVDFCPRRHASLRSGDDDQQKTEKNRPLFCGVFAIIRRRHGVMAIHGSWAI
jgi:drug/metabolite transporter (DMT)-like permease